LSGNDFLTFIMDLRVKAWKEASPANADGEGDVKGKEINDRWI